MSADASVTQTTFFIASLVVAASLAGVIIGISNSMANEIENKVQVASDQMATDMVIINDPRSVPYNDGMITIYVKNVGDISLKYNRITILIDGRFVKDPNISLSDSSVGWSSGSVIEITAPIDLEKGDHSVKVTTDNGFSDTMLFRL
ncbi:MAG: hypothetical protein GX369_01640 [Euryarchaeota archaeon]|nr:hypothetical protein [Euryarchaeota archaeon]